MPYFKKINTPLLLAILKAQFMHYAKELPPGDASSCRDSIKKLQDEINSRSDIIGQADRLLLKPVAA